MNKTAIQPTKGHVLVEPNEKPKEVGGLVLAGDQQNNAPVRGEVLRIPVEGSPFKTGETLYFRKYAIDELKFLNEDSVEETVYIVDEREVLGVLRPEEAADTFDEVAVRKTIKEGKKK